MVAHSQEFWFLTDIEVIPQVLLIGSLVQTIDEILQQFAGTIGCNLMADMNTCFVKKFSATIRSMEYKGKIIQAESFFVVVTGNKISSLISEV